MNNKTIIICINIGLMFLSIIGIGIAVILATDYTVTYHLAEETAKYRCSVHKNLACDGVHKHISDAVHFLFWPSLIILVSTAITNISMIFTKEWREV